MSENAYSKRSWRWIFVVILVLLFSLLLHTDSASALPAFQLMVNMQPTSGPPGTTVNMTGSGWTGNTSGHEIHWDSKTGPILGTFSTNPNGAFTTTFGIPGNASPGVHTVWVCDRCHSVILLMPTLWTSVNFNVIAPPTRTPTRVPPTPTPTDVPTECDASGIAGEIVIDFEGLSSSVIARGAEIIPGVFYKGDMNGQIVRPDVTTKSPSRAFMNSEMMEFGSIDDPLRFSFNTLQDFVGVFVGLNNPRWASAPITATMTARGYPCEPDAGGHFACSPGIVGTDAVTFGPDPTPVKECLAVTGQNIFEVTIDYGPAADPEIIDNLTLRGPEEPEPIPADDRPPVVIIGQPEGGIVQATTSIRLQGEVYEDRELAGLRYRINSGPLHETGFTSAGLTAEGIRRYLFMVDPIPVSEIRTCGDNLVEVIAVDAAENEGVDRVGFQVYVGDLSITSVEAVQVVYGADLVHGKGTAFRALVNSTYTCEVRAKFLLDLPESQWDTSVPSSGRTAPIVPGGWEYPEIWGPVPIPANAHEFMVMLPYIEPGQEDAPFDASSNPAGLVKDTSHSASVQPDIRVVPRPIAEHVNFSVQIDPEDRWVETNEGNNRISSDWFHVIKTRGWKILVIPYTTEDFDCVGPVLTELNAAAHDQIEYLLAAYPIAEGKLSFQVMEAAHREECEGSEICGWQSGLRAGLDRSVILEGFAGLAESEEFDFAVGVDCGSAGGAILGYADAVIIGSRSGLTTLAHEFNHAVNGIEDIYSLDCMVGWDEAYCEYPDGTRAYCCYVDGWTHPDGSTRSYCTYDDAGEIVCEESIKECIGNCNCSIYHLQPPEGWTQACYAADASGEYSIPSCDSACCAAKCQELCPGAVVYNGPDGRIAHPASEGFWVNRWLPAGKGNNYFMDIPAAGPFPGYWMRLQRTYSHCGGYSYNDGMQVMLASSKFRAAEDPQILLVGGTIQQLGSGEFNPLYILDKGWIDLAQGEEGDYYLVLRDAGRAELSRSGFSVIFRQSDPNGGQVDSVPFLHRIEWFPETEVIQLIDATGRIIAERTVSPHAPAIEIFAPRGGEQWSTGRDVQVRWRAEDQDGDSLAFSISMSADEGETWIPVDFNITGDSYTLRADMLEEGASYLVKVRATDGINTSVDVIGEPFRISSETRTGSKYLMLAGLAALAIAGVVILAFGVRSIIKR